MSVTAAVNTTKLDGVGTVILTITSGISEVAEVWFYVTVGEDTSGPFPYDRPPDPPGRFEKDVVLDPSLDTWVKPQIVLQNGQSQFAQEVMFERRSAIHQVGDTLTIASSGQAKVVVGHDQMIDSYPSADQAGMEIVGDQADSSLTVFDRTADASGLSLRVFAGSKAALLSMRTGTGAYLPLEIWTGGARAMLVGTDQSVRFDGPATFDGAVAITEDTLTVGQEIRSIWGTLASTENEHLRLGKVGSPASGNPYYTWKTTSEAVPDAIFGSWDGTTARTFIRADHAVNGVGALSLGNTNLPTHVIGTLTVMGTQGWTIGAVQNLPRILFGATANTFTLVRADNNRADLLANALGLTSTLGVAGAATLSSTLGVSGAATLSSTLGVSGAATLSSTLGVSGLASFGAGIEVTGGSAAGGRIIKSANQGLLNIGVAGAAYDWTVMTPGFNTAIGLVTGTSVVQFPGAVLLDIGATIGSGHSLHSASGSNLRLNAPTGQQVHLNVNGTSVFWAASKRAVFGHSAVQGTYGAGVQAVEITADNDASILTLLDKTANPSSLAFSISGTVAQIVSARVGSGTFLPLDIHAGGSRAIRISTGQTVTVNKNLVVGVQTASTPLVIALDAANDASTYQQIRFDRGGEYTAQFGVAGSAGHFVTGSAANNFALVGTAGLLLSGGSALVHAYVDTGGNWDLRPGGTTRLRLQDRRLLVGHNSVQGTYGADNQVVEISSNNNTTIFQLFDKTTDPSGIALSVVPGSVATIFSNRVGSGTLLPLDFNVGDAFTARFTTGRDFLLGHNTLQGTYLATPRRVMEISPTSAGNSFLALTTNVADPSVLTMAIVNALAASIVSARIGSGAYLPLQIHAGGGLQMTFPVAGGVTIANGLSWGGGAVIASSNNVLSTSVAATITALYTFSSSSSANTIALTGASGIAQMLVFKTGSSERWRVGTNGVAEGGSNAGSDWTMFAYSDAAGILRENLKIDRSSGLVCLYVPGSADDGTMPVNSIAFHVNGTSLVVRHKDGGGTLRGLTIGTLA